MMLLEIKNLSVYYGVIQALKGISFSVDRGEIVALIGANGAGKTTTLHTISGLIEPKAGEILFNGDNITKVPGHKRVGMGIAQVPEGRRVFRDMTVEENLKMGAYSRTDKDHSDTMSRIFDRFPRLKERRTQVSGTLSGGEQQMLAMGRALMSKPDILLLDEPSMGLSPILVNEVFDIIRSVHEDGTTVLLVEQNAKKALNIADRAYVLETGAIITSGDAEELLNDDAIRKAYLGE
ncbi:MAG: ABC transporter ATP-binding protein [Lachnospiraceae bacterium]|nr:ABC transporter ATP-binding protein [Lachnospiraceae bacterium]